MAHGFNGTVPVLESSATERTSSPIATTDAIPWQDLEPWTFRNWQEGKQGSSAGHAAGETTVWQWNYRGYKNKHGSLIQYIATSTRPPEIIALQETNTHVRLPGYVTYGADTGDSLHTLPSTFPHSHRSLCHPTPAL
ncbi:hypothetical protein HPB49_020912 [Dermacentor silvarum]|uniref:Uncharacterized protein n=1 Tax=Dermacentor silvarum TaxID=543639 RepID=A0ACB8DFQ6_DERSI|nr:hypothetical protein HPB49_020912 [Dermacentor silvarum]